MTENKKCQVYYHPESNEIYEVSEACHIIFDDTFHIYHPMYGECLFHREQLDFNLVYIGDL